MSIIQHRDNVITLPIVADDNECRPIFSNNQTLLRGNGWVIDSIYIYIYSINYVPVNFTTFDRLWDRVFLSSSYDSLNNLRYTRNNIFDKKNID